MPDALAPDGAALHYEVDGAGPWLLLIAGQGVSLTSWRPIVPALASRFRVLAYDHRGVRDSTDGDDPPTTTRAMAADAVTVLDAAGAASASVLGHSMGGRVAQWLALDLIVKSRIGPAARRRYFRASAEHDTAALVGGIRTPTLVVHGTDDAITPLEHGRRLAAGIPGAALLTVEGGRHAPQTDHPEVVERIAEFLGAP